MFLKILLLTVLAVVVLGVIGAWRYFRWKDDPCPNQNCNGQLLSAGHVMAGGQNKACYRCNRCGYEVLVGILDEEPAV